MTASKFTIQSGLIQAPWMLAGAFVIAAAALCRAWVRDQKSTKDGRPIDRWSWDWMNYVWGNPEDGVSGQTALIMVNYTDTAPYRPTTWPPLRAWLWSAWRNSTNALWRRLQ